MTDAAPHSCAGIARRSGADDYARWRRTGRRESGCLGFMKRMFDSRRHHWWPKAISQYWIASDGCVTQVSPNGRRLRQRPASFGAEDHTHNVRIGVPWNFSFEETFNRADNAMGSVVDWLITLEAKRTDGGSFGDRLLGQAMNREHRDRLSECLASLVVRSPAMRNRIRRGVEYYRQKFGIADYEADKTLVAMNMRPLLDEFTRRLAQTGKFAVLFSEEREFTFGDGFLQSFPTTVPVFGGPRCIVPLTPTIAVLYCSPSQYMSNSLLATMRVSRSEVDHLNRLAGC